jgi:hydrogenase/urease accessory protein HupE
LRYLFLSMHLASGAARKWGMGMTGKAAATATMTSALFAATAFVAAMAWSGSASAHAIGLSTGEYTAKGTSLVGKLTFARGEVASLAPSIDENRDGHLTAAEVEGSKTTIKDKVLGRIAVTANGAACTPVLTDAGLTEQDGLIISGRWDCPAKAAQFDVDVTLLDDLARGHRHVARTVSGASMHDEVLYGDNRKMSVALDGAAAAGSGDDAKTPEAGGAGSEHAKSSSTMGFFAFFKMGIEHILTGYDHLVFIAGLVLARARLRSLLTIVTAFTVAHSITLALAVLNVWSPSSKFVEPAIALSIAYVGIENFFVKDASKRWRITFPFGLIHGFGFAGALQEINLPKSAVPTALVSFNLGVETGQLAVLALLLPAVILLRNRKWFEPTGVRVLSGAVAVAGGIWFVSRIISG